MTVWHSGIPSLPQFLMVYETQDLKTKNLPKEKKTIILRGGLLRKMSIS